MSGSLDVGDDKADCWINPSLGVIKTIGLEREVAKDFEDTGVAWSNGSSWALIWERGSKVRGAENDKEGRKDINDFL